MIASPLCRQDSSTEKVAPIFLKYVSQRTLAVLLFIVFALTARVGGKESEPKKPIPATNTRGVRAELPQGYLLVYSATDTFDDGGVPYYPHSSYTIYTADGKTFKRVENRIAPSDEIPELVMLPIGSYTVEARSETEGYIRVDVVVTSGRLTVLRLDGE